MLPGLDKVITFTEKKEKVFDAPRYRFDVMTPNEAETMLAAGVISGFFAFRDLEAFNKKVLVIIMEESAKQLNKDDE